MQHHNYSLGDIEGLIPWEREVYVQMLIDHIKQENERAKARKSYTMLIRFVFNLKRLLSKVGVRGPLGTSAAAALAFFKEEMNYNPEVEKTVYKHLKENGFEFEVNENYGESLSHGTYRVNKNICNLEGDIVINIDEEIVFEGHTDTIMGLDVFKYRDVYLTTEDLYANA